ncbi:GNAT family N-acetyltransferase [Galbibacter pacificus]|uniref:GNAT family N-acetyltransferase n=1 Tax=Galbibacter pacificus TaxID=2996052 RepID=A0ABT6FQ22_9FLAO|nr:GNAT family N-acetyltransferase [Galbibacter pacificus]MDG3582160.1 GNAT family N-acetyltransferase [Galbibacter pacificus]MDG3585364.1 GNAT family N-acetyltransferase [Galbibacter pacificus]
MNDYKTLETDRLLIKPTTTNDADLVYKLFNTPHWIRYIGDRKVKSIKAAVAYIENSMLPQLKELGYSNYTVIRKSDQIKIGSVGLYDREGVEGIDIGFAFLPEYGKKGYAFEASKRLLQAAFEDFKLKEIKAITKKDNISSQKLIEKLGLKLEGTTGLPNETAEWLLYKIEITAFSIAK